MVAWYTTSIDIEQILSNTRHDGVHIFDADVVKSFDTVDRDILDCACLPAWFRSGFTCLFTGKFGYGLSLLLVWEWLGHRMGASPKIPHSVWFSLLRSMLLGVGIWTQTLCW